MVADTGAASGPGALRALNGPRPLRVEASWAGRPVAIIQGGARLGVGSIEDVWRIKDEWWRVTPIARTYFEVLLEDRRRMTIFQDRVTNEWYEQRDA